MELFTSHTWFAMLLITMARSTSSARTLTKESNCENNYCGQFSYHSIMKAYPGLFLTAQEIANLDDFKRVSRSNKADSTGVQVVSSIGDGDACCATNVVHQMNFIMTNVYGQSRVIVHMADSSPPRYQYTPQGACVAFGSCSGICVVEQLLLSLLVIVDDTLIFDFFLVPGYCSCKNISV